ncbi:hypothetical protein B7463_g5727, partial [Scytalidium lignicola]
MSDEKSTPELHSSSGKSLDVQRSKNILVRHAPALIVCSSIISLIFTIIINVGAISTIPSSGFRRYYTNFHILEFTTFFGTSSFNIYGIRLYLNAVWMEPQYQGSDSDARPLYKAVGRVFDVNNTLRLLFAGVGGDAPGPIKVGTISTSVPFVLYLLGITFSVLILLVWLLTGASARSPSKVPPSEKKKKQLRGRLTMLSGVSLICVFVATVYLTARARKIVDAINRLPDSAGVRNAGLGRVFLGLAWGIVGAHIINVVLLAARYHLG